MQAEVQGLKLAVANFLRLSGGFSSELCGYLVKLIDFLDDLAEGRDPGPELGRLAAHIQHGIAQAILQRSQQQGKDCTRLQQLCAQWEQSDPQHRFQLLPGLLEACEQLETQPAAVQPKPTKPKLTKEDEAYLAIEQRVLQRVGPDCQVEYSAYKCDADDVPIDNLDEVAMPGLVQLVAQVNTLYGGPRSRDWCSPVLRDPTWLELCVQAQQMMLATRDHHHCFLEGIKLVRQEGQVQVARLCMGS